MSRTILNPTQKARRINLDATKYGTFAEIGAGQEIARWFFYAGGASGTVAKTMSAYDMAVSDAIYGACQRYVSRERLLQMLDHEYPLLVSRLDANRGQRSTFFVVADTVATGSARRGEDGRAWIGIRFQHTPRAEPSQILLHARLHDIETTRKQEAMGLLGVNLVYGAFFLRHRPRTLIDSLRDNLAADRVEINMVQFSGPAFPRVDNRLMSLYAVREGFTQATVFARGGRVVQPGEVLYGRSLLIVRGSFRPVTKPILDMIKQAHAADLFGPKEIPVELFELSLRDLRARHRRHAEDFLLRVDMLRALGKTVLLSRTGPYHLLPPFLRRYTTGRIVFLLGLPNLKEILNPKYYAGLPGGLLEGMGRLFMGDVRLAVYPAWDARRRCYVGAEEFRPPRAYRALYRQLLDSGRIKPIQPRQVEGTAPLPHDVLAMIRKDDPAWRKLVPPQVVRLIERHRAFGYRHRRKSER